MVPDYRAMEETGTRRFLGRRFDPTLGPEFVSTMEHNFGQTIRHGGFVKLVDEPATIAADDPHYQEYVKHLRDGDLWPADLATALAPDVGLRDIRMPGTDGLLAARLIPDPGDPR